MIHQVVTRVSLDSFKERSEGKKVILLYPWTNYRNLFLGHFLSSAEHGLLYYRIPAEVETLEGWLAGMTQEFKEILGNFGGHLQAVLPNQADGAQLGEALALDLRDYSDGQRTILFVDELDRLNINAEFSDFIKALVPALADHTQMAFSSRLLTQHPWYQLLADGDAVVLGTEYRKNDVMFTVEGQPKPQLEVYAFGRGHALVDGQEIENWDGALPRNLFFYFVDNPLVTRDDIFDTFWPALSVKEATNVFHVTKRKISERITSKVDESDNYELTQYASGFYLPSKKVVRHYDVYDFQEAVESAMTTEDPREEEQLYRRAVDLYKAPFLETINMPWVNERRRHLRTLYAQALIGLGRIHRDREEDEEALGYFSRSLKEKPEREDIHREVIKLYIKMGMNEDARQQYRHMERILNEHLNIKPGQESVELYQEIGA